MTALLALQVLAGNGCGDDPPQPILLTCTADSCPELQITGDPIEHDCFGLSPCPVRGHYDPTLEVDPVSDTLWLGYTSGTVVLADPADAQTVAAAHRTHLAKSTDGGISWTFAGEVTPAVPLVHPTSGKVGMLQNEVSTLVRDPAGIWTLLWIRYFETAGAVTERSEIVYNRKVAADPVALAAASVEAYARGWAPFSLGAVSHVLSDEVPELADCLVLTEPGLYARGTEVYLATTCLVLNAAGTDLDYTKSRNVLLRRSGDTYSHVGVLLDHQDAVFFGADSFEQLALADARDAGKVLLIATPIDHQQAVPHQGCVVFELTDLASARIARDQDSRPVPRAVIKATGDQLGPGLCDYDPRSSTGVLLTIPQVDSSKSPAHLRIAVHATGLHP